VVVPVPGTDPLVPLIWATTSDPLSAVINILYTEWVSTELQRAWTSPSPWTVHQEVVEDEDDWHDVEILGVQVTDHYWKREAEANDWIVLRYQEELPVQPLFGPPRTRWVYGAQVLMRWPEIEDGQEEGAS
jgi:hypothetical protein